MAVGTEIQFPQAHDPGDEEPLGPDQEAPPEEPEPEPEPDEEDRLARVEQGLAQISEYLQQTQQQGPPRQPAAPPATRPRPDFGQNTAAQILYDEIAAIREEQNARWEAVERARQEEASLNEERARVEDIAQQYLAERTAAGDPKVPLEDLKQAMVDMKLLRNRGVPYTRAVKLAYQALAYEAKAEQSRTQGQQDVRRPDAKVPTFRPSVVKGREARPQTQRQSAAKPGEMTLEDYDRKRKEAGAALARFSPDEIEDALRGVGR